MWPPMILDVECIVCNKTLQKIKHDPSTNCSTVLRKMAKISHRRSRTPNWSLEEKQFLLDLIKQHKEVVVTKSNNGPNHSEEKDVAWNEILRQLTCKFGDKFSGFSIKKVKTQWQNMKRIAREQLSLKNCSGSQQCTQQSLEVCSLLNLSIIKDGIIKNESGNLENTISTNIEIKTECVDEDVTELDESSRERNERSDNSEQKNDTVSVESSESSMSEENNADDAVISEELNNTNNVRSSFAMTESSYFDNNLHLPFQREFQEFLKYSAAEKQLKMVSLKEEQQIVRAMRETAELNKIIAEQKLKHILWIKKREMSMYSGEPGSGAGKGGGGGGAIREAGGAFGKMEAAREDEYFYKKQKEQLANIKGHLDKEIAFHQEQIKRHEDAIRRHKEQMAEMNENK